MRDHRTSAAPATPFHFRSLTKQVLTVTVLIDIGERAWLHNATRRPLRVRKASRALRAWDALFYSRSWTAKPVLASRAMAVMNDTGFNAGLHRCRPNWTPQFRLSWASALMDGRVIGSKCIFREAVEELLQNFMQGGHITAIGITLLVIY